MYSAIHVASFLIDISARF